MSARQDRKFDQTLSELCREITEAALSYERRWTNSALQRVEPEIARKLDSQRARWAKASVTGDEDEILLQGRALCRGYRKAVEVMEAANEPEDSFVLGRDPRTGFTVAIGHQKAAADRVVELHGDSVVFVSPDEVAAILAGLEGC
jgi:hypothetical protein